MKKNVFLFLCIFFISLFSFISCSEETVLPEENRNDNKEEIEQPDLSSNTAPTFTLKDTNGSDVSLSTYDGKVIVLFFLGSGCPSCRATAPKIQNQIANTYSSNEVAVLGLDQWDGNSAAVTNFKSVSQVTFPLLLNASDVARQYETTYDRLIVIDKNGNIHFKGDSLASQNLSKVVEEINNLIQD
jgi:peroxiredoxin